MHAHHSSHERKSLCSVQGGSPTEELDAISEHEAATHNRKKISKEEKEHSDGTFYCFICGEDLGSVVRVSSHGDRRSNEGDQGPQSEDEQLADKEYFYLAHEIESCAEQTTQVREVH